MIDLNANNHKNNLYHVIKNRNFYQKVDSTMLNFSIYKGI